MGAAYAWFAAAVIAFAGVFMLYYLGINVGSAVSGLLWGLAHSLAHPLVLL